MSDFLMSDFFRIATFYFFQGCFNGLLNFFSKKELLKNRFKHSLESNLLQKKKTTGFQEG